MDGQTDEWPDPLEDLKERLTRAYDALTTLKKEALSEAEQVRLSGKREGVAVGLSYVLEALRARYPS